MRTKNDPGKEKIRSSATGDVEAHRMRFEMNAVHSLTFTVGLGSNRAGQFEV